MMSLKCQQIFDWIEEWAPSDLAEKRDRVGLLVGSPFDEVQKVLVTLEVTGEVIEEAIREHVQLIVSHHPLYRDPIPYLRSDLYPTSLIYRLIRNGIALYAAHTNLDAADGSINDILADLLGLVDIDLLYPSSVEKLYKLVVFVPKGHEDQVRQAICSQGAGWIGNYSDCTFQLEGTGTFRPLEGTSPFIGQRGELEKVPEYRIETIVSQKKLGNVLKEMTAAHPYEEVAYDIYPLENQGARKGFGRVGKLSESMSLADFAQKVKDCLGLELVKICGDPKRSISKVALCGGSAMMFLDYAIKCGADVYLTGDVKHHGALDALEQGIAVVDAGHYATEQVVVPVLAEYIREKAKKAGKELTVVVSQVKTDPFLYI
jgi:dinuclear metal center YbgI/SA1388 family protein